jgi:hypothetical protein
VKRSDKKPRGPAAGKRPSKPAAGDVVGVFRRAAGGYGFVRPLDAAPGDRTGDIHIAAHAALDAFHAAGWAYDHVLAGHGKPLVGNGRARVMRALAKA